MKSEYRIYPIRPWDIELPENELINHGVASLESQRAAWFIVKFSQERLCWEDIDRGELERFAGCEVALESLAEHPKRYLLRAKGGRYRIAHEFIASCFLASPAWRRSTIDHTLREQQLLFARLEDKAEAI